MRPVQRIRERRPQALEWILEPLPACTIHSYLIAFDGRAAAQALGGIAASDEKAIRAPMS